MALFTMTGIAYAAVGEKVMEWFYDLFHAELVTTENQAFIGKEVIDNNMPEIIRSKEAQTHTAGQNDPAQDHLAENIAECRIVDQFSDEYGILPASISEFKAKGQSTRNYFDKRQHGCILPG